MRVPKNLRQVAPAALGRQYVALPRLRQSFVHALCSQFWLNVIMSRLPTKNKRHKNLQNPLEFQCRKTFDVIAPPIPLDAIWEIVGFWVPFFGYQEKQFRATMQRENLDQLPAGCATREYIDETAQFLREQGLWPTNYFMDVYTGRAGGAPLIDRYHRDKANLNRVIVHAVHPNENAAMKFKYGNEVVGVTAQSRHALYFNPYILTLEGYQHSHPTVEKGSLSFVVEVVDLGLPCTPEERRRLLSGIQAPYPLALAKVLDVCTGIPIKDICERPHGWSCSYFTPGSREKMALAFLLRTGSVKSKMEGKSHAE